MSSGKNGNGKKGLQTYYGSSGKKIGEIYQLNGNGN